MTSKQIIKDLVKVNLSKNQIAALVSFIESMGEDIFKNSTLLKLINRNELESVPAELAKWNIRSGRRTEELALLRSQEIALFNQ